MSKKPVDSESELSSEDEDLPAAMEKHAMAKKPSSKDKPAKSRQPRHNWTPSEDLALLRAVQKCGLGNWPHVMDKLQKDWHTMLWVTVLLFIHTCALLL